MVVPARLPPHKSEEPDPGPEHRLAMCELAVEGERGISVSSLELDRAGPSYTVDTLRAIHEHHPDAPLTFILGADIAGTLASWHEPERLLSLAGLAVAARNGSDRGRVLGVVASITRTGDGPGPRGERSGGGAVRFLEMPPVDASSSGIRERVRRGEPIEELVGARVARYIAEHGLYTTASKDGD